MVTEMQMWLWGVMDESIWVVQALCLVQMMC